MVVGTSSTAEENVAQLRPPNLAAAIVQGIRASAPTGIAVAVSSNLSPGFKP